MNSLAMTRREVLKAGAAVAGAAGLSGCEGVVSWVTDALGQGIPETVAVADLPDIDPAFHLLSRAAFGPWPGDLARVRDMGAEAWIEEQLGPESIDDSLCDLRARRFETIHMRPGDCFEFKKKVLREELARHTLLRAVYSRRQLLEVMVEFWTDHFNISVDKGDCVYLKASDDREVIRAHALGRFRDLVRHSALSPAMLVYLDGNQNKRKDPEDVPNENYARELLELHTLGVHGGYTQDDVREVARCLTGWRVRKKWRKGTVEFEKKNHDDGEKTILGETIPAGRGEEDLDRVVEIVCSHPSTARHIAAKLVRRFVSEDPPPALVDRAATAFVDSGGEIKPVLREILSSEEFAASAGAKVKRPFRFVASALRGLAADTHAHPPLLKYLERMGQEPFSYPTPDGYPEEGHHWLGTLLWRWNFAFSLARGKVGSVDVSLGELARAVGGGGDPEKLFAHLIGRRPTAPEAEALARFDATATQVGLVLASPAFQRT